MSHNFTSRPARINRVPRGCYAYNEWNIRLNDSTVVECVEYYRNGEPVGVLEYTIVDGVLESEEFTAYDPAL